MSLSKLLQLHGELTFPDLVLRENFEVASQSKLGTNPNEPLRGVILVPLDGIPIVHGELMMEVVVALTDGDECSDEVIPGSVFVVERCLTEPMSERVDAECRLRRS